MNKNRESPEQGCVPAGRGGEKTGMFGRETEDSKLQKAMRLAGAEPSFIKTWFKNLERMRKTKSQTTNDYEGALGSTEKTLMILQEMESLLLHARDVLSDQERRSLADYRKQLKQLQGKCDHIFMVSPDDREFHSTFDALLKLEPGRETNDQETLILQSEVENLLALSRECLDREKPEIAGLCYYGLTRSGRELEKLPPEERLEKIRRVYRNEFLERMREVLTDCIQEAWRLYESSGHVDKGMEILLSGDILDQEEAGNRGELQMARTREDFEKQADALLDRLTDFG